MLAVCFRWVGRRIFFSHETNPRPLAGKMTARSLTGSVGRWRSGDNTLGQGIRPGQRCPLRGPVVDPHVRRG